MATYYVVVQHGAEYFVETVTSRDRASRCAAGPFQSARYAWQVAGRLATSAPQSVAHGVAHYTTLPSELGPIVDPERPGPRGCWKLPAA